jgi:hypothetical protein
MSMNFSEFKRWLGAEPHSEDPVFAAARNSSDEYRQAAEEALAFESRLERAVDVPVPDDLISGLRRIPFEDAKQSTARRRWLPMAMAASVLVAVGAVALSWQSGRQWSSVEEYLADHYRHDGPALLGSLGEVPPIEVQTILAEVGASAKPELANIVGVIKYCPTPDGKGVHMVLNTERGPVTLIYMPETSVEEGLPVHFDDVEAILVSLPRGSAALMGDGIAPDPGLLDLVHNGLLTQPGSS